MLLHCYFQKFVRVLLWRKHRFEGMEGYCCWCYYCCMGVQAVLLPLTVTCSTDLLLAVEEMWSIYAETTQKKEKKLKTFKFRWNYKISMSTEIFTFKLSVQTCKSHSD